MATSNMENGKAFEYACLRELRSILGVMGVQTSTVSDNAYHIAGACFDKISDDKRQLLVAGAKTAAKMIVPLEPKFLESGLLTLRIASDSEGIGPAGDVRDVLCVRSSGWEVGISCKHNHEALKHPRLTKDKDFGRDWIGMPCSDQYMDEITPVIDRLAMYGAERRKWRDLDNAWDEFYVPILCAYRDELIRLCRASREAPARLMSYFFGSHDFYKVIMMARTQITKIEAFNMHGTLNMSSGRIKPIARLPVTKFPTRLLLAEIRPGTKTTLDLAFDGGWALSMRLHNKDLIAKTTSLAWDVKLEGLPPSMYINSRPWYQ